MSQSESSNSNPIGIGVVTLFSFVFFIEYNLITGIPQIPIPMDTSKIKALFLVVPLQIRWGFILIMSLIFKFSEKNNQVSDLMDKYSIAKFLSWVLYILSGYSILSLMPINSASYIYGFPISSVCFLFSGFVCFNMIRKKKPKLVEDEFGIKKSNYFDYTNYSFNWKSEKEGYLNIINPFRGTLMVGNPGSGKGWKGMEPLLDQIAYKGYTGVIYDFKMPVLTKYLHSQFINYRIKEGDITESKTKDGVVKYVEKRKLWCIDFGDLSRSHRCNPISPTYMKTATDANEMALTLLSNLDSSIIDKPDFFNKSSIVILKTIFWFLRTKAPEHCTIPHAIAIAQMPYEKVIAMLKTDPETARMIEVLAMADRKKAEGQLAGQIASLLIPADIINAPEISYVLSEDDFSLDLNDPENPGILCLGNNVQRQGTYGSVVALIATVTMKQLNKVNRLHSVFSLDEAPTLYIPNYDSSGPATARSNKVAHIYICQAISQIKAKYGDKLAGNITGTLGNHIYLQSSNIEDASLVTRMIGRSEKEQKSVSTAKSGKETGSNYSVQRQNLIEDEEMMVLEVGRMVGKVAETGGKYPSIFNILPDTKEKQRNHAFNPFVTFTNEDGTDHVVDNDKIYNDVAVKKHRYISYQAKTLVEQFAIQAITMGLANEAALYPEHFDPSTKSRILTLWGDPIENGFIKDKKSGVVVGTAAEGYFDTVKFEN